MLAELRISDAVRMRRIVDDDQLGYLSYRAFSAGFVAAVNYYKVTPAEYDGYDCGQLWSEWNDELLWEIKNDDAKTVVPELIEKDTVQKDATTQMIREILAQ